MAPKAKATAVKKTGAKKEKKADGPKRPMSPFFQYLADRRPKLLAEKPDLKSQAKEVSKVIGEEWRKMTEAQRAPYIKKSEDDKKRYEADKAKA